MVNQSNLILIKLLNEQLYKQTVYLELCVNLIKYSFFFNFKYLIILLRLRNKLCNK